MAPKRSTKSTTRKSETPAFPPVPPVPRPERREWIAVALIVLTAALLRLMFLSHASVEHFDEGVYASNLFMGPEEGYRYPDWELYAPPLLPALLEWSQVFFGTTPLGTMIVSILAGTATVGLAWWTARVWFGTAAGVVAAVLAATNDYHLLYSRTALTDALLGFWLLAAVSVLWEAFRRGSFAWSVAAGVLISLAWWTKYNGWLPLAIGLAGAVPWILFHKAGRERAGRTLACWLITALVAFTLWMPALLSLPEPGYSAVQANHRTYLVGLGGWLGSLVRQLETQRFLTGWLSSAGLAAAVLVPVFLARRAPSFETMPEESADSNRTGTHRILFAGSLALLLAGLAGTLGTAVVLGLLAAAGIARELIRSRGDADANGSRALAAWLLAAWFVGLLLSTPLYRPYSRLLMPWVVATWLGSGAALGAWLHRLQRVPADHSGQPAHSPGTYRWQAALAALAGFALLGWSGPRLVERCVTGWQNRDGLERIATSLVGAAEETTSGAEGYDDLAIDFVIYVHGEPGLFYHISRALAGSAGVAQPAGNLGFAISNPDHPNVPTFLAVGPHALRSRQFQDEWASFGDRFRAIATYDFRASDLVLLDEYPPSQLADPATRPVEQVKLYLLEPRR